MTALELYEFALIELNKLKAPSLLIEDYVYFINKAVQQYINITYNKYDINQQATDDLRVLKATAVLKVSEETVTVDGNSISPVYRVTLPNDYMHLLNCIVSFERVGSNNACGNIKSKIYKTAKRLTSDMFGGIINNYYLKPSYKRPYYFINSINTSSTLKTNEEIDNSILISDYSKEGESLKKLSAEAGQRLANPSNVNLEIRCGDKSLYKPTEVYIDYIKAPMYINLDHSDIITYKGDDSQVLEFPDYVCYEIINIFVRLIMENATDPRLQTIIPINETIASSQSGK